VISELDSEELDELDALEVDEDISIFLARRTKYLSV